MDLFTINCTTCRARIKVQSVTAIGQIFGCPKCGGMVQIVPPPGWTPPPVSPPARSASEGRQPAAGSSAIAKAAASSNLKSAAVPPPLPSVAQPASAAGNADSAQPVAPLTVAAENEFSPASQAKWFAAGGLACVVVLAIAAWTMLHGKSDALANQDQTAELGTPGAKSQPDAAQADAVQQVAVDAKLEPPSALAKPAVEPEVTAPAIPTGDVARAVQPAVEPALPAVAQEASAGPAAGKPSIDVEASSPDVASGVDGPAASDRPKDAPAVERAAAKTIDVQARLADRLPAIEFQQTPLLSFLKVMSQLSTITMTLDVQALADVDISPTARVTLKLTDVTVGEALTQGLKTLGLQYVVQDGQLLIAPAENFGLMSFRVTDLADGGPATEALGNLVRKFVQPDSWKAAGGRGTLQVLLDGTRALQVEQSFTVNRQILVLCEKLRIARGKSPLSHFNPDRLKLDTRRARGADLLGTVVTANFIVPRPLPEIVDHLAASAHATIVVDWLSLADVGLAPDTALMLKAENRSLADALTTLLKPLDLTYVVAADRSLQIVSLKSLAERPQIEFYLVGDILSPQLTAAALQQRITTRIAPKTWAIAGGPGQIEFDAAGRCLIVSQPQNVQVQVEALLNGLRGTTMEVSQR